MRWAWPTTSGETGPTGILRLYPRHKTTTFAGEAKCDPFEAADTTWAVTCLRFNKVTKILSETDILFNEFKSWSSDRVEGIAVHELGHAGGLTHDDDPPTEPMCASTETDRYTMCAAFTPSNAGWAASIELHDITDANAKY